MVLRTRLSSAPYWRRYAASGCIGSFECMNEMNYVNEKISIFSNIYWFTERKQCATSNSHLMYISVCVRV